LVPEIIIGKKWNKIYTFNFFNCLIYSLDFIVSVNNSSIVSPEQLYSWRSENIGFNTVLPGYSTDFQLFADSKIRLLSWNIKGKVGYSRNLNNYKIMYLKIQTQDFPAFTSEGIMGDDDEVSMSFPFPRKFS